MSDTATYGTAEHAAKEALDQAPCSYEGYVNSDTESVAETVVKGLRERGFIVSAEPRCDCGWLGESNHYHDRRMGRRAQQGRCGALGPPLHTGGATGPAPVFCSLPHGHGGWHRGDDGAEWSPREEPEAPPLPSLLSILHDLLEEEIAYGCNNQYDRGWKAAIKRAQELCQTVAKANAP